MRKIPQNYSMEGESNLTKTVGIVLLLFKMEAIPLWYILRHFSENTF